MEAWAFVGSMRQVIDAKVARLAELRAAVTALEQELMAAHGHLGALVAADPARTRWATAWKHPLTDKVCPCGTTFAATRRQTICVDCRATKARANLLSLRAAGRMGRRLRGVA